MIDFARPALEAPEGPDPLLPDPADPTALTDATARLLAWIRAFDAAEGWSRRGFTSCAQWMSWRTGIGPGAARERVRVATPRWDGVPMDTDWALGALRGDAWPEAEGQREGAEGAAGIGGPYRTGTGRPARSSGNVPAGTSAAERSGAAARRAETSRPRRAHRPT